MNVTSVEDIYKQLDLQIDNGMEGIIIKDPVSEYVPGTRPKTWSKIKPDYYDGAETLDLCILGIVTNECNVFIYVGVYRGRGKYRGIYSSFVIGVRDKHKSEP